MGMYKIYVSCDVELYMGCYVFYVKVRRGSGMDVALAYFRF